MCDFIISSLLLSILAFPELQKHAGTNSVNNEHLLLIVVVVVVIIVDVVLKGAGVKNKTRAKQNHAAICGAQVAGGQSGGRATGGRAFGFAGVLLFCAHSNDHIALSNDLALLVDCCDFISWSSSSASLKWRMAAATFFLWRNLLLNSTVEKILMQNCARARAYTSALTSATATLFELQELKLS